MKIFLAGCEDDPFLHIVDVVNHKYALFSYFHWINTTDKNRVTVTETFNRKNMEIICDSGLFTLMFGVGKGGNYDLQFMKDYTVKYIAAAKQFGINNLTIVESDVHKLLGMPAVFELRKYFEDIGMNVMHVWHKEEGVDGLMRMAEKYKYIALSIPELRFLFKGQKTRYQDVCQQLLQQIRRHVGEDKMPKIHLLGNTVQETMQTTLAYSCDSTSWLSGGRFGSVISLHDEKLRTIKLRSEYYRRWRDTILPADTTLMAALEAKWGHNRKYFEYMTSISFSALSYSRFQDYLDRNYPWIGLKYEHQS